MTDVPGTTFVEFVLAWVCVVEFSRVVATVVKHSAAELLSIEGS